MAFLSKFSFSGISIINISHFTSLNGMIKRNQFEEAYNVLKYSLQPKKLPTNGQKVSSAHEASPQWKPLELGTLHNIISYI